MRYEAEMRGWKSRVIAVFANELYKALTRWETNNVKKLLCILLL
jgi:hypothetical protein